MLREIGKLHDGAAWLCYEVTLAVRDWFRNEVLVPILGRTKYWDLLIVQAVGSLIVYHASTSRGTIDIA